jgi:hypothetical protein
VLVSEGDIRESLLVNFFFATPVGHVIEALHYCVGYRNANPQMDVSVALNADSPYPLATLCPAVRNVYPITHRLFPRRRDAILGRLPFVPVSSNRPPDLSHVPSTWTWIQDDGRRTHEWQHVAFPGLAPYYEATDMQLTATRGRGIVGGSPPAFSQHQQLRLQLPDEARERAVTQLPASVQGIAVMPTGSGERSLYPSVRSWMKILDVLHGSAPNVQIVLVGKQKPNERTSSSLSPDELNLLMQHPSLPRSCFDTDLVDQLAIVERCDLFVSPHTGFGMAALAVGTPWLTISGGNWNEYFFNQVPFRSIIPDTEKYPCFNHFEASIVLDDDAGEGGRVPSMRASRIDEDLDRIACSARELLLGSLTYETAMRDYFADLLQAFNGDASKIWAIDGAHVPYLPDQADRS